MGQQAHGAEAVQTSDDAMRKPLDAADVVDAEQESGSEGVPTGETGESSTASQRLLPVPDSQRPLVQIPPVTTAEDTGKSSASCDRNCPPSKAPVSGGANYDQLSYSQLHEL